jgi:alpha-tubulin suppressor-like RCC1 family protein
MVKRRPLLATLALSKLSLSSQSTESNNEISFSQPRLIYSDKQIESVCAGAEHCLLLTVDGQVLVHGSNRYGQLGIGNRESVSIGIQRCIFDDTIGSIFSGQYHCAALSRNNGRVYCWGWGLHGQLALADQIGVEDSLLPMHVRYFE